MLYDAKRPVHADIIVPVENYYIFLPVARIWPHPRGDAGLSKYKGFLFAFNNMKPVKIPANHWRVVKVSAVVAWPATAILQLFLAKASKTR